MKAATVNASDFTNHYRLDSAYYLSEGSAAIRIVQHALAQGARYYSLGDKDLANIWQPNRNTLIFAGYGEEYVPYLQPYDILEFLPEARSKLSAHQKGISSLHVTSGTILQTCSGRNLGPLIIADKYLEKFAFGSDLIRINVFDSSIRYYIYAFLNTWVGQAILHSNKTGSVIDHLSARDIEKIKIPVCNEEIAKEVANLIEKSFELFSQARLELDECRIKYTEQINIPLATKQLCFGWTSNFQDLLLGKRLDAAYHAPPVSSVIKEISQAGGQPLASVSKVFKPSGRYKTNYVDRDYGVPILSGRQLLQNQVIGIKYLPRSAKSKYSEFVIKEGWIAFPVDGRVEGRLGTPAVITAARDGWYASVHVGRVVPFTGVHPGYIYLALSHPAVQAQISALACGSVVDSVYPSDAEKVVLTPQIEFLYDRVVNAWYKFDESSRLKQKACDLLLSQFS